MSHAMIPLKGGTAIVMPANPTQTGPRSSSSSRPRSLTVHQPEGKVRVTLDVPSSLFDLLEEQAIAKGRMVEDEMIDRLRRFLSCSDPSALYFSGQQKSDLERALGHTCNTADIALAQLRTAISLRVGDVAIPLEPRIQTRIASRAKAERRSAEDVLKREVTQGLERYVGIRPY